MNSNAFNVRAPVFPSSRFQGQWFLTGVCVAWINYTLTLPHLSSLFPACDRSDNTCCELRAFTLVHRPERFHLELSSPFRSLGYL